MKFMNGFDFLDLGQKRTFRQAVHFYLAYLLFIPIFTFGIRSVTRNFAGPAPSDFEAEAWVGAGMSGGVLLVLALVVLHKKGVLGNLKYTAIAASTILGALVGGVLIGLLPVAYLTTVAPEKPNDGDDGGGV